MELYIRQLKQEHFEDVKVIFRKAFDPELYPDEDLNISWIERSDPDSYGFFYKDRMIGFAIASYHIKSGSNMYVDYIALDPEYRGNGLGSTLLCKLIEKCYKRNGSIHLYPEREELLDWYMRHGFRKTNNGYYVFHSYNTRRQHVYHKALGLHK